MTSTHTEIQLFIKANNLRNADIFSKSDPYALIFDESRGVSTLIGRTEVVNNSLEPSFQTPIEVKYYFEMLQLMHIELWDKDKGNDDEFLGRANFSIGQLVSARGSCLTLPLDQNGTVTITAAYIGHNKGLLLLTMRAVDLCKPFLGSLYPSLIISRRLPNGRLREVNRTLSAPKTTCPKWKSTPPLDLIDLCGGNTSANCIHLEVCNCGSSRGTLGSAVVSAEQLMQRQQFTLTKQSSSGLMKMNSSGVVKTYGTLIVDECLHVKACNFLDYLKCGMEINIAFAIDFTGSNGLPSNPQSLHHFTNPLQKKPNNYVCAMLAVSNVVQEYDKDRMFPVFGFGAVAPFTQGTSHFFPLNGDPSNAYVSGMQSVVETYERLLPQLQFSGPTNFSPTIRALADGARRSKTVYTILLMLTDGAITDMAETVDAIVAADDAPLSIVIIGIGNADFSSMVCLDGDRELLRDRWGRVARRDLVQFMPFNEFEGRDPALLGAALLEEIPRQVEEWGRIANLTPESFLLTS